MSNKQTPYYTGGIGSKRGSQDTEKLVEGKNAYYTNNAGSSNPMTRDQLKESTRFSSNERAQDNKDAHGRISRGSSNRDTIQ